MTYVSDQTPAELRAHMKSLKRMSGWHEPLADRLWKELQAQDAEIASLRAELTYAKTYRKLADDMSDANLKLRAERAANNELYSISQSDLAAVSLQYDAATAVIERLEAAARQDAEKNAAKERERKFQNFRADSAEAGWAEDRAILKQYAEEATRLQFVTDEVVQWWDGLPPHLRQDIEGSGAEPGAIARARAALACRPEGEPAPSPAPTSTAHGVVYEVDTGGVIPSARPQDGG